MKKVIYKFLGLQGVLMFAVYFVVDYYFFNKGHNFLESLITAILFSALLLFVLPIIIKALGKLRKLKAYTLEENERILLSAQTYIPAYMSVQKTELKLTNKNFIFLQGREEQVFPYNKVELLENRNIFNSKEYSFFIRLNDKKTLFFLTEEKQEIMPVLKSKL